jgi:hypothetical protein
VSGGRGGQDDGVAADEVVIAGVTLDEVVALATFEIVVAEAALDPVLVALAEDRVIAALADDVIRSGVGSGRVVLQVVHPDPPRRHPRVTLDGVVGRVADGGSIADADAQDAAVVAEDDVGVARGSRPGPVRRRRSRPRRR